MNDTSKKVYGIAIIVGAVLWTLTATTGGRSEPWDAPGYWSVGYPLAVVLSGVLGYLFPRGAWRWAAALMFMQAPVMIFSGAGLSLFPMGLIALTVLSLPAVALAAIAARLSLRTRNG